MRVASVGARWAFKKCWWGPSHVAGLYNSSISSSWLTNSLVVQTGGGLGNSLCCLHSLGLAGVPDTAWGPEWVVSTLVPLCHPGDLAKASGLSKACRVRTCHQRAARPL